MSSYIPMTEDALMSHTQRNRELCIGREIKKIDWIPSGTYCNADVENWCQHLSCDYCHKYSTHLLTKGSIEYGFHAQTRCQRCQQDFTNGGNDAQIKLF